ncbi:hypothetical protein MBLNU13_g03780t1 [Cladosporium sp. NU13]
MPLSAKQMEYLALAWQCFESEPKIDYNKFATVARLKTPASARELMRVTKNKLRDEYVASHPGGHIPPNMRQQHTDTVDLIRYGALSSGLQTSNGATTPKTPTKNGSATPKAAATPASRKRARQSPEKSVGVDEHDDDEERPAGKKAKAKAAENGVKRKEVKSEPLADDCQDDGEEVSFF